MKIFWILKINFKNLSFFTTCIMAFNEIFIKLRYILNHLKLSQGRRQQGVAALPPPPPPPTFLRSKKKKGRQKQKRKGFKAETIKRLLPRSKYYCFSYRIRLEFENFSCRLTMVADHGQPTRKIHIDCYQLLHINEQRDIFLL